MALTPQAPFQIFINIYDNKKKPGKVLRALITKFMKFTCHYELFIDLPEYYQTFIVYQGGAKKQLISWLSLRRLLFRFSINIHDNKKKSGKVLRALITKFAKFTCHYELFIDLPEYYQSFVVYQGREQKQRKLWLSHRRLLFRFSLIYMTTRKGLARY